MPTGTGPRATASKRMREAIVAATVRVVAREGVAAVSHRRVAAEAGVGLSSTTWHFATKAEILEAALEWTAGREVERIGAIADRLGNAPFDLAAWADGLADWLVEEVTTERETAIALYRLQVELLGSPRAREVHRRWGESLLELGDRALRHAPAEESGTDVRLIVAALDGLRMGALSAGEEDEQGLRDAVRRQLQALLG